MNLEISFFQMMIHVKNQFGQAIVAALVAVRPTVRPKSLEFTSSVDVIIVMGVVNAWMAVMVCNH